jgi:hypothetical protein
MRKAVGIVSFVTMFLMVSLGAFAQEVAKPTDTTVVKTEKIAGKCCKGDKEMKEGFMPQMMMGHMMTKQMVATSDGGVIVLVGNKIIKYDKNLNLVKETEIKMDMEGMKCGMMEKKWHHDKKDKGEKEEANEASEAPVQK